MKVGLYLRQGTVPNGIFTLLLIRDTLVPSIDLRPKAVFQIRDPDWIRILSGPWIRIRIHESKNETQK
jgi:hypothetical protein